MQAQHCRRWLTQRARHFQWPLLSVCHRSNTKSVSIHRLQYFDACPEIEKRKEKKLDILTYTATPSPTPLLFNIL
jgi:hypothetical protein